MSGGSPQNCCVVLGLFCEDEKLGVVWILTYFLSLGWSSVMGKPVGESGRLDVRAYRFYPGLPLERCFEKEKGESPPEAEHPALREGRF